MVIKKGLASGHAIDPAANLRFILEDKGVASVIVGTINPDHLASNVAAVTAS